MNTFRKIAFGYSTRCNIRCRHCVAADDVPSNAKMDIAGAKAIIREMAVCNVRGISFTAGEPLLFLRDIAGLIRLCKQNGIYTRVVTNAFWADTPERADHVVSELKDAGLAQLRISASRWHQEHVRLQNIVHAGRGCTRAGLDYFISFVTDFSNRDDSLERFLRDNQLKFFPEPVIYFGRAGRFDRPRIFSDYPPHTCAMNPYLSPELDMFACCDAGNRFTETDFFLLGNLKEHSIEELFQRYERNNLYSLIKTIGLTNMASSLGFKARDIVTYRKCELCEKLFNSKENLSRIQQAADSNPERWVR